MLCTGLNWERMYWIYERQWREHFWRLNLHQIIQLTGPGKTVNFRFKKFYLFLCKFQIPDILLKWLISWYFHVWNNRLIQGFSQFLPPIEFVYLVYIYAMCCSELARPEEIVWPGPARHKVSRNTPVVSIIRQIRYFYSSLQAFLMEFTLIVTVKYFWLFVIVKSSVNPVTVTACYTSYTKTRSRVWSWMWSNTTTRVSWNTHAATTNLLYQISPSTH